MARRSLPNVHCARAPAREPAVIDMEEFGRELVARRAALGNREAPRNTLPAAPSKRALLAAIEKAGARW